MRISDPQFKPIFIDRSQCKIVKPMNLKELSLDPSDNTYTKKEAVEHQYLASFGSVSLDDLIHGKATLKLPSLSKDSLETYEKSLETNGLGGDINWDTINDIGLVSIDGSETNEIGNKIDYIASRYAVLKGRINTAYSGEEQKKQTAKLDQLFSEAGKRIADSYATAVGGFFENCGVSGETEKLQNSVLQNIGSRIAKYSDYLQNDQNYASVDSKSDRWLLNDDSYLAEQLRKSMSGASAGSGAAAARNASAEQQTPAYSMRDLEVAGAYAMQASACFSVGNPNPDSGRNEEYLGLDMAMQAMKTDYLAKNSGVGSNMGNLLNRAFEGTMKDYVGNCAQSLERCANSGVIDAQRLYTPLDKSAVYSVYQVTMERYHESGDILGALIDGERYAKQQYDRKAASNPYNTTQRYSSSYGSFANFFQSKRQWNPDYDVGMSDFQKYSLSLNYFVKAVKTSGIQSVNMMFGSSGDLSIDNITPYNLFQYSQDPNWNAVG